MRPTRSGHPRHHLQIRQGIEAQENIEITALACEQWPGAANTSAVEGTPVLMLAVAVPVVAVICDAMRGLDLKDAFGNFERVLDARVPGIAQPQTRQVEVFHTDQGNGWDALASPVAHVDPSAETALRHCRCDADVIALDAEFLEESSAFNVRPVFEPLVPVVGERERVRPVFRRKVIGSGNKRGNFDAERKRADPGISSQRSCGLMEPFCAK